MSLAITGQQTRKINFAMLGMIAGAAVMTVIWRRGGGKLNLATP